jgi:adenylate cyclase
MSRWLSGWRGNIRLVSALVLFAFVLCHLAAHSFLLVSIDYAESVLTLLMEPWRSHLGTAILVSAALVHCLNALWSVYVRRSLRLMRWEWWQLGLGLLVPALLMSHLIGTRVAEITMNAASGYASTLVWQWIAAPWFGVVQVALVLLLWTHACIGIHFWLRTKLWYADWQPAFFIFAFLLPVLGLSGYIAAGNHVLREANENADFVRKVRADSHLTDATAAAIWRMTLTGWSIYAGLVLLPFAARSVRHWIYRRRRPPLLTHPSGQVVPILSGATVLEILRDNGIAHASVCGGRARCTTCRIQVTRGLEFLPPPSPLEARALARIEAPQGMRLACQLRPTADISLTPLLAVDAVTADGTVRGGLEGSERPITVVFVDLRGSTTLAEGRFPYDVLFILNQFFREMNQALIATNGHYSQFTGDGLMALYGLYARDPAAGVADALRGAGEMLTRLDQLNRQLQGELREPLRIGIGIHFAEAIVGAMGPPRSRIISAIGDTVNTAARLESLTKEFDCPLILSLPAAQAAGLALSEDRLHETTVKGRQQKVQFYALETVPI